jgi:hypothetical protein
VPAQFEVTGAAQLANLSKALRNAGQNEIRKQLLASIRKATAPAKEAIPESARATLPRRGGLNEFVAARLDVKTRNSLSGQEATVRITATEGPQRRIRDLDNGIDRHPVWGNRNVWATTHVQPGFFTRPCAALAPAARQQIAAGMNQVLAEIARAAR